MPLESDADRLAMLQALGEEITVGGTAVWAIVDNEYVEALSVTGTQPVATCRSSDVTGVTRATTVVRGGVTYRVANIEPDGTGMTLLRLERS
jgi:high-affinity K+ transport system ATPase subunit B